MFHPNNSTLLGAALAATIPPFQRGARRPTPVGCQEHPAPPGPRGFPPSSSATRSYSHPHTTSSEIVVFLKGTRENPKCRFSKKFTAILNAHGILGAGGVRIYDVLQDSELREDLKHREDGWPTFPALWVGGVCIGGWEVVRELAETNRLREVVRSSVGREHFLMQRELEGMLARDHSGERSRDECGLRRRNTQKAVEVENARTAAQEAVEVEDGEGGDAEEISEEGIGGELEEITITEEAVTSEQGQEHRREREDSSSGKG